MTQSDEYDTIKEVVWKKVRLNITPKEFKQLSKWSENIYNTAVIIDYFVDNQPDIEECYNLAPVVKHLRNDADVLNAFFIDHEKDVKIQMPFKRCLIGVQIVFTNFVCYAENLFLNFSYNIWS